MKSLRNISPTWACIIAAAIINLILCLAGVSAFIDHGFDISSGTSFTAGLFLGFFVAALLVYRLTNQNLTDLQKELSECNSVTQKLRNALEMKEGERAFAAEELIKAFSDLEDKEMVISVMTKRISTLDQENVRLKENIDSLIHNYNKIWTELDLIKRLSTQYVERYSKQLRGLEDWKEQARKIIRLLRKENQIFKTQQSEIVLDMTMIAHDLKEVI